MKTAILEEKKSKFYGYAFECFDDGEIKKQLDILKKEHKKATHFCYAFRFTSPFSEKAVDDGEPSGTAGKPILNVLQKKNLQNICVIVVRYFGGIKLGAGGLVRAYTKVTSQVLS